MCARACVPGRERERESARARGGIRITGGERSAQHKVSRRKRNEKRLKVSERERERHSVETGGREGGRQSVWTQDGS